jgi:PEP-CTERM/exosortase A-associated glycosyltransferase
MKILHLFDHSLPVQDGYASRSWAILQEQIARGWTVLPTTGPRQGSAQSGDERVQGMTFYRTQDRQGLPAKLPVLKQLWAIWLMYRRLCTLIPQLKPDLVHAHSPALNGVAAHFAARRFGLPLVYEVRAFWEDAAVDQGTSKPGGLRYRFTRALENFVFARASRVVTICDGLRQDIEARQLNRAPVTVVPNAVDYLRFSKEQARDDQLAATLGLQMGRTLGFVGSFYDYEGLDQAITAMPHLLERDPSFRLLLVGGGMQDEALRAQAKRLGLDRQVIFTGKVPFSEVERYYSVIDALVYPRKSLRLTETVTPLKPLEAMALRKLFVASDVGGHRELVRHGETGILFKADNTTALVEAVHGLLGDMALQQTLRQAGLAHIRDERNWRNSVARYAEVYGGALNTPQARPAANP